MLLLLAGRLEISVGSECHELGPGDDVCSPSTQLHRYANPGADVARAFTAILPGETPPGPSTNRRT
jgi:mannose-6-phosphate isomerase-like protein (cupin superfamily)